MATKRYGRYETIRLIASGGMASVYLGRATGAGGFERLVAVKVMHAHIAHESDFVSMFLDEARLAAKIRHPNVVPTLDVAPDGRFIVMEYIEGASLYAIAKMLRKQEGALLPLPCALRIVIDGLNGLHAAHELRRKDGSSLNIVHRDISPQNLLVGVDGISRITDFGVARAESRITSTRGAQLKGKLPYMAPEQLRNEPIDRRADVYAAGVVLWEVLAGRPLFRGDSDAAVAFAIMGGPQQTPRQANGAVPASVDSVCMQALGPASERFQTAEAFAEALEEAAVEAGLALARPRAVGALARQAAELDAPPPGVEPGAEERTAEGDPQTAVRSSASQPNPLGALAAAASPPPSSAGGAASSQPEPGSQPAVGAAPPSQPVQPPAAPSRPAQPASAKQLHSLRSTIKIDPRVPDDDATVPMQRSAATRQAIEAELERRRAQQGSAPGSAPAAASAAAESSPGPAPGAPLPAAGQAQALAVPHPLVPAGSTPVSGVAPLPGGVGASGALTPISGVAPLVGRVSTVPVSGTRQVLPSDSDVRSVPSSGMYPPVAAALGAALEGPHSGVEFAGPAPRRPVAVIVLALVGVLLLVVGGAAAWLLGSWPRWGPGADETSADGSAAPEATAQASTAEEPEGTAPPTAPDDEQASSATPTEAEADAAVAPSTAATGTPAAGAVPTRPPPRPRPAPKPTVFHPVAP